MAETYYCEKCNRTMNGTEFYSSNNLENILMMVNFLCAKNV